MTPQLIMLAGPNGAGKSTFYDAFLSESPLPFVNADLFATETGLDAFQAARVLDAARDQMIADRRSFITETVFSDPHGAKLAMLQRAVDAGYDVTLIYVGISSARLSAHRVDQRVNLKQALRIVPTVQLYDNSSFDEPYRLVATFQAGRLTGRMRGGVPRWARVVMPPARKRRRR